MTTIERLMIHGEAVYDFHDARGRRMQLRADDNDCGRFLQLYNDGELDLDYQFSGSLEDLADRFDARARRIRSAYE